MSGRKIAQIKTPLDDASSGVFIEKVSETLFDFGFFEFYVLLGNRIVFPLDHFFRHGTGILLGNVEVTRVSSADETDFDCCSFCHFRLFRLSRLSGKARPSYKNLFQGGKLSNVGLLSRV